MSFELPPILPDVAEELKEYLVTPENLSIYDSNETQEFIPRDLDFPSLFHYDHSPLSTTLKVQRDLYSGKILGFQEVPLQSAGATARNSMSLNREPVPSSESTRGNAMYYPFWPGSFSNFDDLPQVTPINSNELLTTPPTFKEGLLFEEDNITVIKSVHNKCRGKEVPKSSRNIVNLLDLVENQVIPENIWKSDEKDEISSLNETGGNEDSNYLSEEKQVLPEDVPVLKISETPLQKNTKGTEWAILLDTSKTVKNFNELVPEMAHEYPFELDPFQKQAIIQLEKHNHVFVAAHTSAGKTVVAEYAIALSQKHMTRTIYTSPIKALSNQKYRDFKRLFKDVGLVTGDFQINQTASCLIMTTEILRSMLYCGSDVTRDLEYVIFDEVHYVNDKERGHVWEQVLIMLPAHVCVVLLSATVPNAIEFADWLGYTNKKKVYVITTDRRPVPLKHYLYTGCGGSTKDNRYLILNSEGKFNLQNYNEAVNSLKPKEFKKVDKNAKTTRPPIKKEPYKSNMHGYTPKQEKTMWEGLIGHLQNKELLPVVAFVFSRAKCDDYAHSLVGIDLTTQKEKSHIHVFFEKCIRSLKEQDRNIPQILETRTILEKGIGVHHSGVLPIIKEMVEMLFQSGLVKVLFATETFAMGVNMPARTVVFDSITKHDGRERRTLLPAEYIQMAGRAGRRGLDDTGTVMILCKGEVPKTLTLEGMMLGKPSQLSSQFRLVYGMVLSLLRVESLSVEGMMSRSFCEAHQQKNHENLKEELAQVEKQLLEEHNTELGHYMDSLVKFYQHASSYLNHRKELWPKIIKSPKVIKEIAPGQVVLLTHKNHVNKFGILLQTYTKTYQLLFKVLILKNKTHNVDDTKPDKWYKMLSLADNKVFRPDGIVDHEVLQIDCEDIFEIVNKQIKVDTDLVIKDWEKRQIPRFRDDPPSQTCSLAIQELLKVTQSKQDGQNKTFYLDLIHDLKINDLELREQLEFLRAQRELLEDSVEGTKIPNFHEQFFVVFSRKSLEDKQTSLKFTLSYTGLSLYPDYERRIKLLRALKYVDSENRVELKGRVACEMGMNELLITELVLRNILTKLQPEEVAALLSSLVFQAKTKVEPVLTKDLEKGKKEIEAVHKEIVDLELKYQIDNSTSDCNLNFGLVQVVYEWANAKPFAEIMNSTDVQEGIIVRCIQQLNEILCDVRDAAKLIGDPELQSKMEEASTAVKRDIVFAASLYTQKEAQFI